MSEEKIIGVEQEAKVYRLGPYKLTMVPITELSLPAAEGVLKSFASIKQFEDETLIGVLVKIYARLLKPVLRVEGTTLVTKALVMLRFQTPLRILAGRHTNVREVGEIVQDFFVLNFGSTQQSGASSSNILLNLTKTASPATLTTLSTH